MPENDKPPTTTEICSIRIGFPVKSDDQAISYKKKISEILAEIPEVRIDFSLTTIPTQINHNAS